MPVWICLPALLMALVVTPQGDSRTWTDSSGKYKIEAEFVDCDGVRVRLERHDLKIVALPLEGLSEEDQKYVCNHEPRLRNGQGQAAGPKIDFYGKKVSFLKLFGQTRWGDTSPNRVTSNRIYHAAGVVVDRSSSPNHIYVADTGHNRFLGFRSYRAAENRT